MWLGGAGPGGERVKRQKGKAKGLVGHSTRYEGRGGRDACGGGEPSERK
jgi:hypothetical protein